MDPEGSVVNWFGSDLDAQHRRFPVGTWTPKSVLGMCITCSFFYWRPIDFAKPFEFPGSPEDSIPAHGGVTRALGTMLGGGLMGRSPMSMYML